MAATGAMDDDEAALYDRQIRLWGAEAQKRMRSSRLLVAGMRGLAAETLKNCVLAGVHSVTILDSHIVQWEDLGANFFLSEEDVGKNRAEAAVEKVRALNPMVKITTDTADISTKDDEYFSQFDIACIFDLGLTETMRVNNICREKNVKFFAGSVFGMYGFFFADLGIHEYVEETRIHSQETGETTTKFTSGRIEYVPLSSAVATNWSAFTPRKLKNLNKAVLFTILLLRFRGAHGRSPVSGDEASLAADRDAIFPPNVAAIAGNEDIQILCANAAYELSPIAAIVGGLLSQEVLKAASKKEMPHNNLFVYNGIDGTNSCDQYGA
eukprot:Opistho-2@32587